MKCYQNYWINCKLNDSGFIILAKTKENNFFTQIIYVKEYSSFIRSSKANQYSIQYSLIYFNHQAINY